MKKGSGTLDFGGGDDDSDDAEATDSEPPVDDPAPTPDHQPSADTEPSSTEPKYPYFVRRSNVGDERDKRLELHVREQVASRESEFRSRLAEELDTDDVSKTDAREFALLAAFENPQLVAELMEREGFGELG